MKYPLAFLLIGISVSGLAVYLGGWWHLLHWFTLSGFTLAAGYAGLGARVFAKRADGTIPLPVKVLHFPFLLYTRAVWHLIVLVSRENATDEVTPHLILGRRLRRHERLDGVDHTIDLTAEFEDPKVIRESPGYLAVPVLDGSVPRREDLDAILSKASGGVAYVHCAQGHGRTGTVAVVMLIARGEAASVEAAMERIKKARPGVRLNSAQRRFVEDYVAKRTGDSAR